MVVIFDNTAEVIADLRGRLEEYQGAVIDGFAEAGQMIADRFRDNQLSGRTGGDIGLNIRTGRLHDSIKSRTEISGPSITSVVYNTGAPYWRFHQDPDGQKKRLFLEEDFQDFGQKLYVSMAEDAMQRLAA